MKKLFLCVLPLVTLAAAAACCWTLLSSEYDFSLRKWVCIYQSSQGTIVREFQNSMCTLQPQYH